VYALGSGGDGVPRTDSYIDRDAYDGVQCASAGVSRHCGWQRAQQASDGHLDSVDQSAGGGKRRGVTWCFGRGVACIACIDRGSRGVEHVDAVTWMVRSFGPDGVFFLSDLGTQDKERCTDASRERLQSIFRLLRGIGPRFVVVPGRLGATAGLSV
jgi:hypothetical protein